MQNLQRRLSLSLLAVAGLQLLSGCSHTLVTTTVQPDGAWTRNIKVSVPRGDKGMPSSSKMEDVFALPTGPAWKVTKGQTDQDVIYTLEQKRAKPGMLQDLVIKGAKKTPILTSKVSVRAIAPGQYEYREVLHWTGDPMQEGPTSAKDTAEAIHLVKVSLPTALATDANAKSIADALSPQIVKVLFGPPSPLITELMTNPDLAGQQIFQRLGKPLDTILQQNLGGQLSTEERLATERKIIENLSDTVQVHTQAGSGMQPTTPGSKNPDSKEQSDNLVALTYRVKLPGKVISSNGEVNDITDEVFWGLYPEAASAGDVELKATCQMGP
ncbi:MAG: hypothetical protein JO316_13555 [Abitibacteriaceae bacterium]|nr:hypothetical protein [Abditibacteriaceae bacterium]